MNIDGAAYRSTHTAHFFADLFRERNRYADADTIILQFQALAEPYPEAHHERIACPALIISGSEDFIHQSAFVLQGRIPGCELKVVPGAGHACHMEQPWLFDRLMLDFFTEHGLFPGH